jgi:hypothetical protein
LLDCRAVGNDLTRGGNNTAGRSLVAADRRCWPSRSGLTSDSACHKVVPPRGAMPRKAATQQPRPGCGSVQQHALPESACFTEHDAVCANSGRFQDGRGSHRLAWMPACMCAMHEPIVHDGALVDPYAPAGGVVSTGCLLRASTPRSGAACQQRLDRRQRARFPATGPASMGWRSAGLKDCTGAPGARLAFLSTVFLHGVEIALALLQQGQGAAQDVAVADARTTVSTAPTAQAPVRSA